MRRSDNMEKMEPDIHERVMRDFATDLHAQVESELRKMKSNLEPGRHSRIVRCVLYLAKGDVEVLRHHIKNALDDFRDVIWWAEYDAADNRLHDFNQPFEEVS